MSTAEGPVPITNVRVTDQLPTPEARMPERPDGSSGNLNQGAWFNDKDAYLELSRDTDSPLVDEYSIPNLTTYRFGANPLPVTVDARACLLPFGLFCVPNVAPCWHPQQVVTFVDSNMLYSFFVGSDETTGQAFLLETALLDGGSSVGERNVAATGTVAYFEPVEGFNHPGDMAIFGKIALVGAKNWDPTPAANFVKDTACSLMNCGCEPNFSTPIQQSSLILWDFTDSVTEPTKRVIASFTLF